MFEQMTNRLHLLRGGPRDGPARQRPMRDAIDWSYELPGEPEQAAFRCLAVFGGVSRWMRQPRSSSVMPPPHKTARTAIDILSRLATAERQSAEPIGADNAILGRSFIYLARAARVLGALADARPYYRTALEHSWRLRHFRALIRALNR